MSIKLHLKSPTMGVDAFLAAEAMPALLKVIEEHQLAEPPEGEHLRLPGRKQDHGPRRRRGRPDWSKEMGSLADILSASAQKVRDHIADLNPKAMLEKAQPATFPEKFLVIIGWLEAKRERRPIRPEIGAAFARWPLEPSGNPARDFKKAVNEGWLARDGREIGLTEAGWTKLGEMCGMDSGEDTDNDALVPA